MEKLKGLQAAPEKLEEEKEKGLNPPSLLKSEKILGTRVDYFISDFKLIRVDFAILKSVTLPLVLHESKSIVSTGSIRTIMTADNNLYLICQDAKGDSIQMFDPTTDKFTEISRFVIGKANFAFVEAKLGSLARIGGVTKSFLGKWVSSKACDSFKISNQTIMSLPELKVVRSYPTAFYFHKTKILYATAGFDNRKFQASIEMIDLDQKSKMQWITLKIDMTLPLELKSNLSYLITESNKVLLFGTDMEYSTKDLHIATIDLQQNKITVSKSPLDSSMTTNKTYRGSFHQKLYYTSHFGVLYIFDGEKMIAIEKMKLLPYKRMMAMC